MAIWRLSISYIAPRGLGFYMKMPPGKCVFNREWKASYKWVKETQDRYKALCCVCNKVIDIGAMGESALKSHRKGAKHRKIEASVSAMSLDYFGIKTDKIKTCASDTDIISKTVSHSDKLMTGLMLPPPPSDAASTTQSTSADISNFLSKNDVLKSEILWTLHTVVTHASYKSNEHIADVFHAMFPDSALAAKFSCAERKTSYLCVFGIAEHLKKLILSSVSGVFVILFDESLNKKMQEKQMDIHVRFWDGGTNQVVTRYLGSQFLGHATADDIVDHFREETMNHLNIHNMVQISMDGPNVNWKVLDIIQSQINTDYGHDLINIGSCGLHTVHNAFKAGALVTEWGIASLLRSLYYLFKDSPARREDYQKLAGTTIMPLKFVDHRWLENVPVSQRALQVWDSVELYVKKVQSKQLPKPTNKSFDVVSQAVKDKLIRAKLEFFCFIATILQPFLANYQTDKPMVPFMVDDLTTVIKCLMRKVVKPEVLDQATTPEKLLRIDLEKTNLLTYKKVDIGLLAEEKLRSATTSEKEVMEFRMECMAFVIEVLKKITVKSPITYSLVRNMVSLCPREMARHTNLSRDKFKKLMKLIIATKRINVLDGEVILQQYNDFLDRIIVIGTDKFTGFDPYNDRLDTFFVEHMSDARYGKLLEIVKLLLTLSHGQATVERGFSVNKEVECENLKGQSVVAQRIICDYVRNVGGVLNVPITNQLLVSAASARQKYETYLQKEREKKQSESGQRKRKHVLDDIEDLKRRKKQARLDYEILVKKADELSLKAEKTLKWQLLAQANANRKGAEEKLGIYEGLCNKLDAKIKELKGN